MVTTDYLVKTIIKEDVKTQSAFADAYPTLLIIYRKNGISRAQK